MSGPFFVWYFLEVNGLIFGLTPLKRTLSPSEVKLQSRVDALLWLITQSVELMFRGCEECVKAYRSGWKYQMLSSSTTFVLVTFCFHSSTLLVLFYWFYKPAILLWSLLRLLVLLCLSVNGSTEMSLTSAVFVKILNCIIAHSVKWNGASRCWMAWLQRRSRLTRHSKMKVQRAGKLSFMLTVL